ncbi:unnamed protein product [Pleuronectes platessa]|uniref:Uncharacterized protein n=1 Tax=Pleuronectes platessa TaxID=8262 RepID=A0A9N7VGF1_PLEPL|nr:unnamed protein product [Pleuronectes platessa]
MRSRPSREGSYGNAGDSAALRGIETGRGEGRRREEDLTCRYYKCNCLPHTGISLEIDFFIIHPARTRLRTKVQESRGGEGLKLNASGTATNDQRMDAEVSSEEEEKSRV